MRACFSEYKGAHDSVCLHVCMLVHVPACLIGRGKLAGRGGGRERKCVCVGGGGGGEGAHVYACLCEYKHARGCVCLHVCMLIHVLMYDNERVCEKQHASTHVYAPSHACI